MKKLLIILLLLVGCGSKDNSFSSPTNNPYYNQYRLDFIEILSYYANDYEISLVRNQIMTIPIAFEEAESPYGICNRSEGYIIIHTKNKLYERMVVFHELAHCVLNLDHIDDYNDLMFPVAKPNFNYQFIIRWLNTISD